MLQAFTAVGGDFGSLFLGIWVIGSLLLMFITPALFQSFQTMFRLLQMLTWIH